MANDPDGDAFFERKIRPVLVEECYSCHSAGAKSLKGGLLLDTRAGVADRGRLRPGGRPRASRTRACLIEALRHEGLAMPPKGKLPDAVIADFERWVEIGAPDPRDCRRRPRPSGGIDLEAGREFWAYQPPRRHAAPRRRRRRLAARPTIDRFLLAAPGGRGACARSRDADRATLIRRLSFDLIGLPPSPEEIDAFVDDPRPGRLRAAGRPPARLAPLRRALGTALARRGPLRRVADAPRLRLARRPGGIATT